ncbi:hypothetical protein IWZ03DRAFT_62615 [Phyllosticta citriasiana]|uniref:Nephrocystin 3-like N-terminal domain-containing protein n=1 Tax=Phyllosticta citriasiana TaxID=595635 RepID=A0ABR1KCD1_9PEZI
MSSDHMDESTCTLLHRSIPDRLEEVPTKYNVTCERINFTHGQQRRLLAQHPIKSQDAAPSDLHNAKHTSLQPPGLANALGTNGMTNGLLDQSRQDQGLWEPYTDWLQSNGLVYWIVGYQRSGKSTLMRFLRGDKTVQARARLWASGSRLVKICFFLRQPTTYPDFLRELLYRAADGRPDMFPDLPDLPNLAAPELDDVFVDQFLGELATGGHGNFLIMIDGVEHLEDGGYRLSKMLSRLLRHTDSPGSSIKVCISTPYDSSLLCDAFGPSVLMENLTRFDLWRTISDELNENKEFSELCKLALPQAQEAIRLVVESAEGSFLYARLAAAWFVARLVRMKNISSWCQDSEAVKELFKHIPTTSEKMFKEMLDHEWPLGPSALTLFGLFGQAEREKEPLSPLVLSFAEEPYVENMKPGVRAATSSEIDQRLDQLRRHLFIRCGGLVEAPDAAVDTHARHHKAVAESKDTTLEAPHAVDGSLGQVRHHEVVGDWKDTMWKIIDEHSNLKPNLKPLHLQRDLRAAYLRRIKSLDTTQPTFFTTFRSLATACLKYSIKIEEPLRKETGPGENPNLKILVALNTDAESLLGMPQPPNAKFLKTSHSDPPAWSVKVQSNKDAYLTIHPHWTNVCEIVNYQPPSSFFDFGLQHGLYSIVEHHLQQKASQTNGNGNGNGRLVQNHEGNGAVECQNGEQGRDDHRDFVSGRILPLTLIARTQHTTANLQPISIKMARILFRYGADANDKQTAEPASTTAWQALLKAMAAEMPKETKKQNAGPKRAPKGAEQIRPQADGKAHPPSPEQVRADRKKREADQARRMRLAKLAVLFLESNADPYATVRKIAPDSDGGDGGSGGKKKDTKKDEYRVVRFVKSAGKHACENVVAAANGVRGVPARLQRFRVRVRETRALTRDVDSQKLTVDEIVAAMPWKRKEQEQEEHEEHEGLEAAAAAEEDDTVAGDNIPLADVTNLLGQGENDDDDDGEEEQSLSAEESALEEDAAEREKARAKKESDIWQTVMQTVENKRREVETRDKKIKKKVLRERVLERAKLFAR